MDPLAQGTVNQQLVQWKALDLPAADSVEPETEAESEATE